MKFADLLSWCCEVFLRNPGLVLGIVLLWSGINSKFEHCERVVLVMRT